MNERLGDQSWARRHIVGQTGATACVCRGKLFKLVTNERGKAIWASQRVQAVIVEAESTMAFQSSAPQEPVCLQPLWRFLVDCTLLAYEASMHERRTVIRLRHSLGTLDIIAMQVLCIACFPRQSRDETAPRLLAVILAGISRLRTQRLDWWPCWRAPQKSRHKI